MLFLMQNQYGQSTKDDVAEVQINNRYAKSKYIYHYYYYYYYKA